MKNSIQIRNVVVGVLIITAISIIYIRYSGRSTKPKNVSGKIDMSELRVNFFKDFNNTVLTVDGILISIIGGFTVASGSNNLLAMNGFEILILSMIFSFLAHSSLTSGLSNDKDKIDKSSFLDYSSEANYSFWYFIMGVSLMIGSFMTNV